MTDQESETCLKCGAQCCKHLAVPMTSVDHKKWIEGRAVAFTKDWWALVTCRCRHLTEGNLCDVHGTKPKFCADFVVGGEDCNRVRIALGLSELNKNNLLMPVNRLKS